MRFALGILLGLLLGIALCYITAPSPRYEFVPAAVLDASQVRAAP